MMGTKVFGTTIWHNLAQKFGTTITSAANKSTFALNFN
jgi:hypothetical protein